MNSISRAALLSVFLSVSVMGLYGCAGSDTSPSTGQYIDDRVITTKVKAKLVDDPLTKALQINVDTYKGSVQLSGFVDSAQEKARAEEVARAVEGVKDVRNNLTVKTK